MYINQVYEFSMVLDNDTFEKAFTRSYRGGDYLRESKEEYVDPSLSDKGILIIYRNTQYKKKVKLIVNLGLSAENIDSEVFIRKLDKRVVKYFNSAYCLEDFSLTGLQLRTDINVGCRDMVVSYLKVLKRLGKVKGFSPTSYDYIVDATGLCLHGNSSSIDFLIYDLEQALQQKLRDSACCKDFQKSQCQKAKGILRIEARLSKTKAIQKYTASYSTADQMVELSKNHQTIFFSIFSRVIPYGDFLKKEDALEMIRNNIDNHAMRRKMLRLLALIPEKKSLHLAQKAMSCRNMGEVMDSFAQINLSPVTISKRQETKHLKNLYTYFD